MYTDYKTGFHTSAYFVSRLILYMYIGSNFHIQDFFKCITAITVVVCKCLSTVDRLFAARKTMLEEELKVS